MDDVESSHASLAKPRTKNGMSHTVRLPIQVLEALMTLPKTSEWVFRVPRTITGPTIVRQKTWMLFVSAMEFGDVHLHDLRRSCAS